MLNEMSLTYGLLGSLELLSMAASALSVPASSAVGEAHGPGVERKRLLCQPQGLRRLDVE